MKKNIETFVLLFAFITLSSGICSKSSDETAQQSTFPGAYIFMIDDAPDKLIFFKTNGSVTYRDHVLKTYDLTQLAKDENCKFYVRKAITESGQQCYAIQLDKKRNLWLSANLSSNKQEVHLLASSSRSETEDPGGDNYKFQMHITGTVNGVRMVAIESVEKPGWYISSSPPGFQYAANLVTLQQATSPEKATHWQCR